jgi:hypothetical protein
MAAISRFLISLPLLPDELKEHGYPSPTPDKPAILIDQVIMKRSSKTPEEVHAGLVISGFIMPPFAS